MNLPSAPLMAIAQAHETLDALVFRVLGKGASAVAEVFEANPNLADTGVFLPLGQPVVIPLKAMGPSVVPMVQLWT